MHTIAFLYPGQGAQVVGMGTELFHDYPQLFQRYLLRCDAATGLPITRYCLEGPVENLAETHIAQPALFALSLALTDYALQAGLSPNFVAGHSLGEYTAAVAAGVLSFEEGLSLVCQRGELMREVQHHFPGAMAAVIELPLETVQQLCSHISRTELVVVANINSPTQLTISGTKAGIDIFAERVAALRQGKIIRLQVRGAFHSPLMLPVQYAMASMVRKYTWKDATIPSLSNSSGKLITTGLQVREALVEQIANPVQWTNCVRTLVEAGCDTFLEFGPKPTLARLVSAIAPNVDVSVLSSPHKIDAFLATPLA